VFFFDPALLWMMGTFFAARKIILEQISMVDQWHEVLPSLLAHHVVSA